MQDEFVTPATNWVLVSDLGLAAYKGTDGMAVDIRSLATGKPLAGIAVRLYARNNGELAAGASDAEGIARIPGGLLRGRGGDEPFVLTAHGPDNDFNFLEIGHPAFDLSDRGVSGRPQPGPVDAFLYTDRGIYRPGETVELVALVRDDKAEATTGLPVSLRLMRPDGIEVEKRQLTNGQLGGYRQSFALPRDARIGSWRVELRLDPKAPPIGSAEFRVEDFVPPQLKLALAAAEGPIRPGTAFPVDVDARYYYGAPGAELPIEAEAVIALDDDPFPTHPGFKFGLADEEFTGDRRDIEAPSTDGDGKARLPVVLNDLPDVTRPLAATIRVGVFEPSGRAVYETLARPIRQRPVNIGLRSPAGDDAVPEGAEARIEVIAVDPLGAPVAVIGLRFELLRETWEYRWYSVNGVWRHKSHIRSQPVDAGTLDLGIDHAATLARQLPAGRYRWEVADPASGAQSSLKFHVGWWIEAEQPDVPDKLEAVLDKPSYQPGETAKLFRQGAVCRRGRAGDRVRPDPVAAAAEPARRGRHSRHPGRSGMGRRRLCAGQRLPAVGSLRTAAARAGARRRGRMARDRRKRAHARGGARRARCRAAAQRRRDPGHGRRPRRRGGGVRHPRRGRRGGAQIDRVRQPGPRAILFRQAPARGRAARYLWPADRCSGQRGRGAAQRRRQLCQALGRRAARQEQQGRCVVFRGCSAGRRWFGAHPVRHSRLSGAAPPDGGRLLGP